MTPSPGNLLRPEAVEVCQGLLLLDSFSPVTMVARSASTALFYPVLQGHSLVSAKLQLAAGFVQISVVCMQSFFYLWRVTGKQLYRDWNWQIVQAFENHSRTDVAHAAIQVRLWGFK